jgi:hypothetical protein
LGSAGSLAVTVSTAVLLLLTKHITVEQQVFRENTRMDVEGRR